MEGVFLAMLVCVCRGRERSCLFVTNAVFVFSVDETSDDGKEEHAGEKVVRFLKKPVHALQNISRQMKDIISPPRSPQLLRTV